VAEDQARLARVERLLGAARRLAQPEHPDGHRLRAHLLETCHLSAAGIELGLSRCLELHPTARELDCLLTSTPESPRAHVLLAGNVFVAALRAIAIGLASSSDVWVRPSRRDPALARALHALAPDLFQLTPELAPAPGDHVWAYGSDSTLAEVRAALPPGSWFHEHGSGIGAVALRARAWRPADAREIALDAALFDGQGCLSPRVVCVAGSAGEARDIARAIASELGALERELPLGARTPAEAAAARRARDAATYAFEVFDAGSAWVSYGSTLTLPPSGRNLHVLASEDPGSTLAAWSSALTCVACNEDALGAALASAFAGARVVGLGAMQRPPLDGPVDRRKSPLGERV
jgi:hypothetical protein